LAAPQRVSATVIYYPFGELINDKNMLRQIKGPVLGHFATHDFALTPDKVKQFTSKIKQSGVIMTAYMYDAKHGFDKPTGKNFSEDAHKSALDKTYKFLNKHMQ
jgi:carboxymethylenebutenolidase